MRIYLMLGTSEPVWARDVPIRKLVQQGQHSTREDWWLSNISTVMGCPGKWGFQIVYPNMDDSDWLSDNLPCSTSCRRATEEKLFEIEAMRKTVLLSIGSKASFFSPRLRLNTTSPSCDSCNCTPLSCLSSFNPIIFALRSSAGFDYVTASRRSSRIAVRIMIVIEQGQRQIQQLEMKEQAKDAAKTDLKALYKKLDADKKMAKLKAMEFILEANKTVGLDDILLREGFESFPSKAQMESKRTLAHFEAFFEYMESHGEEIEAKYLQQSSDSELMKEASSSDPHNYNFLLNKNSVSKFIRDEATHYQRIINAYLEATPDAEKAIPTKKVSAFMTELFNSSQTAVLLDGKPYFGRTEVATDLGGLLADFGVKAKGLSAEEAQKPFMIEEEEVLDFLTHWLKESCALNLYVLYARTATRLQKEVAFLANSQKVKQQQPIHPSRMTNEDFIAAQTAAEAPSPEATVQKEPKSPKEDEGQAPLNVDSPKFAGKEIKQQNAGEPVTQTIKSNEGKGQQLRDSLEKKVQAGGKNPKQEGWRRQLKSLFEFGCKRRYKLSRLSTFQDIQLSTRTMDLQKFVYFCNFFELLDLMTRELITEYFRMHATERLIDYPKFVLVMQKLVKVNPKVAQRLQNKKQFEGKLKQHHIRKDMKLDRLSDYKFALRPINGKDVSSIEKELDYRRLEKAIAREEKDRSTLNARQLSSRLPVKNIRSSKLSFVDLEPIRDSNFNPEKLIVGDSQHDHLWEAYEAKIWKRQEAPGSALQTILAKRMEKGSQIITKMNSQRSFMQE